MTHQEIKALAGHRAVPPWIMKLVSDAIAIEVQREREACAKIVENEAYQYASPVWAFEIVNAIRDRGDKA